MGNQSQLAGVSIERRSCLVLSADLPATFRQLYIKDGMQFDHHSIVDSDLLLVLVGK